MILLFPGRHHLLTDFQFKYLYRLVQCGLGGEIDLNGGAFESDTTVDALIFPVTSANHANTRRNPVPFYLRAMALEKFCGPLSAPTYIYGIDDVGNLSDFASYTLKRIAHLSEGRFQLTPQNTVVLCSTPVLEMYESHGFRILPMELTDRKTWSHATDVPWALVERIAHSGGDWRLDNHIINRTHPASFEIWTRYGLGERVALLFRDVLLGEDGDITRTRDYNSYVRQMDEIARQKYHDTSVYIQPGRIGDIGCAVGSWLKFVSSDQRFRESDLYGVEVVRHLFDICEQRKSNGEFDNPFVFFSQKNAITGLVFEKNSMHTIHTSSLTHEIESYGGREDLHRFIENRFEELAPDGVWINRDVIGPVDGHRQVLLWLNRDDGVPTDDQPLAQHTSETLSRLSTYARFMLFSREFRKTEGYTLTFSEVTVDGTPYIQCALSDACEFLSKKDYTDNWASEMHETFCFWSYAQWIEAITRTGFTVHPDSHAFTNEWIVENRWKGKAALFTLRDDKPVAEAWPETHMILVARKR